VCLAFCSCSEDPLDPNRTTRSRLPHSDFQIKNHQCMAELGSAITSTRPASYCTLPCLCIGEYRIHPCTIFSLDSILNLDFGLNIGLARTAHEEEDFARFDRTRRTLFTAIAAYKGPLALRPRTTTLPPFLPNSRLPYTVLSNHKSREAQLSSWSKTSTSPSLSQDNETLTHARTDTSGWRWPSPRPLLSVWHNPHGRYASITLLTMLYYRIEFRHHKNGSQSCE